MQKKKLLQYNTIQYNTIQYNTIQYNTIQYNTIQYNTIQYNTIQYNTIQYNTIQYNTIQYNTIQYNTIQYNTIQYNTIQYNTIQYNTIQYNTIQYNTIQYNTIQYNTIQYNIQYIRVVTCSTAEHVSARVHLTHVCVRLSHMCLLFAGHSKVVLRPPSSACPYSRIDDLTLNQERRPLRACAGGVAGGFPLQAAELTNPGFLSLYLRCTSVKLGFVAGDHVAVRGIFTLCQLWRQFWKQRLQRQCW